MNRGVAQKRPLPVEYLIYEGNVDDIKLWVESFGDEIMDHFEVTFLGFKGIPNLGVGIDMDIRIKTKEGTSYPLKENQHVIVRGEVGEYWPVQIDIFEKTYDVIQKL